MIKVSKKPADLLSYSALTVFFGITALIWLTSVSEKTNNALHKVVNFWPPVVHQIEKVEVRSIKSTDYPDLTSKRIHINTVSQDVIITDSDSPQHLTIKQTYTKTADTLIVKESLTATDLLVEISPDERTIDFPIEPVPSATYEFQFGALNIPTYVDFDGLASNTLIDLQTSPLQTLDLSIDTGNINVYLTKESLPKTELLLESDKGDVVINLPNIGFDLKFKILHDGSLTVPNHKYEDEVREQTAISYPSASPNNFKLNITTNDGDIEIKNSGERPPVISE